MTAQEEKKAKALAKKMASFSLENDRVTLPRVRSVLEAIQKNPPRHTKRVLAYYLRYLKQELRRTKLTLEHAGAIEQSAIQSIENTMTKIYGRDLDTETHKNPELIAGIRVTVGDDVWDSSVSNSLSTLAHNLS